MLGAIMCDMLDSPYEFDRSPKTKDFPLSSRESEFTDDSVMKQVLHCQIGYDLSRTCDESRPKYHHVETCQQTVPEAITAFMERAVRRKSEECFIIPVIASENDREFTFNTVQMKDGQEWLVVFTSPKKYQKGEPNQIFPKFYSQSLRRIVHADKRFEQKDT